MDLRESKVEDYVLIKCRECREYELVEVGTWALDARMCEKCYWEYQGG